MNDQCVLNHEKLKLARYVSLSFSNPLPDVQYNRLSKHYDWVTRNMTSKILDMSYHYYHMKRLSYPYTDNCFNYSNLGFLDRLDITNSCYFNQTAQFLKGKIIQITHKTSLDFPMFKYINEGIEMKCKNYFHQMNCNKNYIFARSFARKLPKPYIQVWYELQHSQDPSASIELQPKINRIDYMCFVLGAIES